MRIDFSQRNNQVLFKLFPLLLIFLFPCCGRSDDELPVIPPVTHPLERVYVGYGVVNVSFTHLLSEPGSTGVSIGYLRKGTIVRIIERRVLSAKGSTESWVLAEGNYEGSAAPSRGWLQENAVDVYDNESMAKTASKAMNP